MSTMTLDKLKGVVPDNVIAAIPAVITTFQLNTPPRLAHFLAQCGHESGGFKVTTENLNYSAEGLMKIFPKYFPTIELAKQYERQPQKIANRVYANRMGNGDEASGTGWMYRGRGYIQLTGKSNYTAFGAAINEDVVKNPDAVATTHALLSAAWFFSKNCAKKADIGANEMAITAVTKCVNGGTHGIDDRRARFNKIYPLLS